VDHIEKQIAELGLTERSKRHYMKAQRRIELAANFELFEDLAGVERYKNPLRRKLKKAEVLNRFYRLHLLKAYMAQYDAEEEALSPKVPWVPDVERKASAVNN
jgi:hypothetical protein